MNYCAPSISPDHIEINYELRGIFSSISNHYTCISGYAYENGSFRGETYAATIRFISGENIMRPGADLPNILSALRELWGKTHEPRWDKYFRNKYSIYPNYPVDIRMFYSGDNDKNKSKSEAHEEYKYCVSVKELEFMIMVFDIYVKHNLHLLPCA